MVRAYNMYCSLHLINVHIKKIQIIILLFKNRFAIYDLRLPFTTLNFPITFYRKSSILTISETVVTLKSTLTSTFTTYDL